MLFRSGLVQLMARLKEKHIVTSLDMAAFDANTEAGKADWVRILKSVMPYIDCFMPSIEELCFMLDKRRFAIWCERAKENDIISLLDIEKDIKPLVEQCMAFGAKVLVVKCGAKGIYYKTASKKTLLPLAEQLGLAVTEWADKEGFEKSFVPDEILSATGAGDTTVAAFLAAMLKGYGIEKCIALAAAEGASCVASYDALGGIKSLDVLEEKIQKGWPKQ